MSFDAFVSYSHAADGLLAPKLQDGLQRMGRALFQRRALHVFRDESSLSTSPHLWSAIESSLLESEWFVFLASPRSAESEWVRREVDTWLEHKPLDKLLIVVTDGELAFSDTGHVDLAATDCLPPSLTNALVNEPRWLDLRWARDEEQLDLRNGRFRAAVADLAAPMHGIGKDDLESEDVRQQRRARRLSVTAATAVSVLALAATASAVVAVRQRNVADDATQLAVARGLSAEARAQAPTDIDLATLLAVEAFQRDDSIMSRTSLLTVLESGRRVNRFVDGLPDNVSYLDLDEASNTLWTVSTDGTLQAIEIDDLEPRGTPLRDDFDIPADMDVNGDGTEIAVSDNNGLQVIDSGTGETLYEADVRNTDVEFDSTGRFLLLGGFTPPEITLIDLDAGEIVGRLPATDLSATQWPSATFIGDVILASTNGYELQRYDLSLEPVGDPVEVPNEALAWNLQVSPQGDSVVIDYSDGKLTIVDANTLEPVGEVIEVRGSRVADVQYTADGSLIAVSADDGSVTIHSTADSATLAEFQGLNGAVGTVLLSDGQALSISHTDGQAVEWNTDAPTAEGTAVDGPDAVMALTSDPESGLTYSVHTDGTVRALDESGAEVRSTNFGPSLATVWSADLHTGTQRLAVGAVELDATQSEVISRRVLIVDAATLDLEANVEIPQLDDGTAYASALRFDPDGSSVAVGTGAGTLMIIDVESGEIEFGPRQVEDSAWLIGSLSWSPDGTALYVGGQDGVLRTFETANWSITNEISLTPTVSLMRSAVSADRTVAAVPSESGELFLFDTVRGEIIGEPLTAGGTQLQAAALSSDGETVAALSRDGTLRLWDLQTRQQLGPPLTDHQGFAIALAPLGLNGFVSGGLEDFTTVLWSGDPQKWIDMACARAGRNLTALEWRTFIGDESPTATCPQWPLLS